MNNDGLGWVWGVGVWVAISDGCSRCSGGCFSITNVSFFTMHHVWIIDGTYPSIYRSMLGICVIALPFKVLILIDFFSFDSVPSAASACASLSAEHQGYKHQG